MTDISAPAAAPKPNLDIGRILSGSFSVLFSRFWYFAGVTFLAMLVIFLVLGGGMLALGGTFALVSGQLDQDAMAGPGIAVVLIFVFLYALGFAALFLVLARSAVTVRLGQGVQFGAAVSSALAGMIPFVLTGLLVYVLFVLGFILFIVPGLYVGALVTALMPAIAYERAGFRGLARSFSLTRGYRWTIVGVNLIWFVLMLVISFVVQMILGVIMLAVMAPALMGAAETGAVDPALGAGFGVAAIVINLISLLLYCVFLPLTAIFPSVIYARLIEIKEGGAADALRAVFE